jgi:hypothetical protein
MKGTSFRSYITAQPQLFAVITDGLKAVPFNSRKRLSKNLTADLQRVHLKQELGVVAGLTQTVNQQLHGFHRGQRIEHFAQNPYPL